MMFLVKVLRQIAGIAVFPFAIWGIVSLFRGDFAGLGLAVLFAFLGFLIWAMCHSALERGERAQTTDGMARARRLMQSGDWDGAALAMEKAVHAIKNSYTRDRGQPELAVPYAMTLVIYGVALGASGNIRRGQSALEDAEPILERMILNQPQIMPLLAVIDDLQSPYATPGHFRAVAAELNSTV